MKTGKRTLLMAMAAGLLFAGSAQADIPGRATPAGTTVPNPGTQAQELANITFPAPYNVFDSPSPAGPVMAAPLTSRPVISATGRERAWPAPCVIRFSAPISSSSIPR
ncbi:MAG: hypothetical protein AB1461_10445 [Thermodesulfobacteriota bacterium]